MKENKNKSVLSGRREVLKKKEEKTQFAQKREWF